MIDIKGAWEIQKMRAAGKLAALVLEEVGSKVRKGVSTLELNDYANEITLKHGATSAPFMYRNKKSEPPFPKHICTSINNVVCHGVPKANELLKNGDIINLDITVILNGYHGDTSKTFCVGNVKPATKKLVDTTKEALMVGIRAVKPGNCISEIGKAIEEYIKPLGYGIVEQLTGHGIGRSFHEDPPVFHFYNPAYKYKLKPGLIFTIEPMINQGGKEVYLLDDGWTIVTADKKLSAQFEHTILVTDSGHEILTQL